ncbi:MAG: ankyrin repeat domain-containing protein [Nitrospinales bacterium]
MHLRRGNVVKRHVPEKNIVAGIKSGKLVATDEISFDSRTWDALGEHPSFCGFFEKNPPSFVKRKDDLQTENVAGLFRRSFAFFVDILLAVAINLIVAFILFRAEIYYEFGGSLLFLLTTILYFTFLESRFAKGKTFGQLLMSIRAVDKNGAGLPITSSLIRASFFFLTCGGLFASADIHFYLLKIVSIPEPVIAWTCFIVFSFFFMGNLIFILLHSQKRGLHDLISGSILVYRNSNKTKLRTFSEGSVIGAVTGSIILGFIAAIYILSSSNYFQTADLTSAKIKDDSSRKKYHIERMQATDWTGWTDLHRAVARKDLKEVTRLIDEGMDVDTREDRGATALYEATRRGYLDIMQFLLNKGADVNAKENNGFTPLHIAAEYHQADAMRLLITNKANLNARSKGNHTPLRQAAAQAWHEDGLMAEILIDSGADMTIGSYDGCFPIYCAIGANNVGFVSNMLERGANANMKKDEQSILEYAVTKGNLDMVRTLLDHKANVNYRKPSDGSTALMVAIEKHQWDIAKLILNYNPNFYTRDNRGRTALIWAKTVNRKDLIQELLKRGVKY